MAPENVAELPEESGELARYLGQLFLELLEKPQPDWEWYAPAERDGWPAGQVFQVDLPNVTVRVAQFHENFIGFASGGIFFAIDRSERGVDTVMKRVYERVVAIQAELIPVRARAAARDMGLQD